MLTPTDVISPAQVSALCVCGREIYVGTSWGCIIVAEAASMRPITVFRPHQHEVRAILTLWPDPDPVDHGGSDLAGKDKSSAAVDTNSEGGGSGSSSKNNSCPNTSRRNPSSLGSTGQSTSSNKTDQQPLSPQQVLSPSSQKSFSNISSKSVSSFSLSSSSVTSSASSSNLHSAADALPSVIDYSEPEEDEEPPTSGGAAQPLVVTVGRGYRNLLARYAPMPKAAQQDAQSRAMFCLIWRANSWTC